MVEWKHDWRKPLGNINDPDFTWGKMMDEIDRRMARRRQNLWSSRLAIALVIAYFASLLWLGYLFYEAFNN